MKENRTYQPTIGLEIHIELKTKTKMFCSCLNNSDEREPNINVCPVCLAHPGVLPVINREAVKKVLKLGLALHCQLAENSFFERKSYFYPDLPKGYQISQYQSPLCRNGFLEIGGKKIRIERIHLEEDTARLVHSQNSSLIDFNRSGVPLMELVTEPDIENGQQVKSFAEELQRICRYLDLSEADMERGEMRVEVNVSVRPCHPPADRSADGDGKLGTKVEIKNLNSFRAAERAVDYEINRQSDLLETDGKIIQETRGWNENKQMTFSQRIKEEAHDYRYFPEPDLPVLNQLSAISYQLSAELPELPAEKRERFINEYKLSQSDIEILVNEKVLADYFEQAVSELRSWVKVKKMGEIQSLIKLTANYLITEIKKLLAASRSEMKDCRITPENFAEFITMLQQKEISSSAGQTVLKEMFETGADPSHIIEAKELKQVSEEGELKKIVQQVIRENPGPVQDFKAGKSNALQFLIGQAMKASKGKANPETVGEILKEEL